MNLALVLFKWTVWLFVEMQQDISSVVSYQLEPMEGSHGTQLQL